MIGGGTELKQGVNEMRLVDLRIEDIAFGGKGVAREQGKAVFVPYTIEGETCFGGSHSREDAVRGSGAGGVKESSPYRVPPECPISSMRRLRLPAH